MAPESRRCFRSALRPAQIGTAFIPARKRAPRRATSARFSAAREDRHARHGKFSGKLAARDREPFPARSRGQAFSADRVSGAEALTGKCAGVGEGRHPDFYALVGGTGERACPCAPRELIEELEKETIAAIRATAAFVKE
jgi:hypothetical protein